MSRKAVKEEAGNGYTVWRLTPNPAFTNHCDTICVQEAVHNIMRISILVASTLSLIKLKSSTSVVCQVVVLNVLLLLNKALKGGHYGYARDPSFRCS